MHRSERRRAQRNTIKNPREPALEQKVEPTVVTTAREVLAMYTQRELFRQSITELERRGGPYRNLWADLQAVADEIQGRVAVRNSDNTEEQGEVEAAEPEATAS
jgi:ABC-type uncharacterized transport system ATPase subunit